MLRSAYPQAQGSIGRSGTDLEEQSGASRKRSCCKCVAVRISDASNLALYLAPSLPKENVQRCLEDTLTDCGGGVDVSAGSRCPFSSGSHCNASLTSTLPDEKRRRELVDFFESTTLDIIKR
ncbi:hypothetical protein MRX96_007661 [Rhipicephalus microplus]